MIIRQDFREPSEMPPRGFMDQIMDSLSKFYCFLWDHKDEKNLLQMSWREVSHIYNKNAFRTNLRKLSNHGLISYQEFEEGIKIEMVGWDEMQEKL